MFAKPYIYSSIHIAFYVQNIILLILESSELDF